MLSVSSLAFICARYRAPHHVIDPEDVAQANANGVLLEAQDDVAVEEVAREYAVPRLREGRP
jgi:hypothetical protein